MWYLQIGESSGIKYLKCYRQIWKTGLAVHPLSNSIPKILNESTFPENMYYSFWTFLSETAHVLPILNKKLFVTILLRRNLNWKVHNLDLPNCEDCRKLPMAKKAPNKAKLYELRQSIWSADGELQSESHLLWLLCGIARSNLLDKNVISLTTKSVEANRSSTALTTLWHWRKLVLTEYFYLKNSRLAPIF